MTAVLPDAPPSRERPRRPRRPGWRQWLVEAERGITAGFRSDSVFFVHLFAGCLAVAAAALLGLSATQWAVLTLALTVTAAAELFHQVLKGIGEIVDEVAPRGAASAERAENARRLAAAAAAMTTLGAAAAAAILLAGRLWDVFAG